MQVKLKTSRPSAAAATSPRGSETLRSRLTHAHSLGIISPRQRLTTPKVRLCKRTVATVLVAGLSMVGISAFPANATNLIVNGSFESPDIPTGSVFGFFSLPGWTRIGDVIELQDTDAGTAQDGTQYVELDANINYSLSQLATGLSIGTTYDLKFFYSPRPDVPQSSNGAQVSLDGSTIFNIALDGTGNTNTVWSPFTHRFTATSSSTTVVFTGTGTSDSAGALIDNVILIEVPGPLPLLGVAAGLGWSRKLRNRIKSSRPEVISTN